jgi:hypothetical protein
MAQGVCRDCEWFDKTGQRHIRHEPGIKEIMGYCRKGMPMVVGPPIVFETGWCSEFKQK